MNDTLTSFETGDNSPTPGDTAICGQCGQWAAMGDDGRFRELTDDEADRLCDDDIAVQMTMMWHIVRAEDGP